MIDEIIDYVDNFDSKNISVSFLFTNGRSGSVLLQSLVDNHPQVISTLFPFSFYDEWDSLSTYSNSIDELVLLFFNYLKKNASYDSYLYLGEKKDKSTLDVLNKVYSIFLSVLNKLKIINRKNFFLSFIFSLAKINNYNLSNVKSIFHHEHYFSLNFLSDEINDFFKNSYIKIDSIYHDFSKPKIIITVRHPFYLYNSHINFFTYHNILHLHYFYYALIKQIIFNYYFIYDLIYNNNYSKDLKIIKFEDIHLNFDNIIKEILDFLDIDYSSSLSESTISGHIWWGNNPLLKPINGINPNFSYSNINLLLEEKSKAFCSKIFSNNYLGYKYDIERTSISFDLSELIENEFESLLFVIFKEFLFVDSLKTLTNLNIDSNIFFSERYIKLRKTTLSLILNNDKNINNEDLINLNGISFFIKNIIRDNFICPVNGFFIFFGVWNYCYLPIKLVYELNKKADQIWVPNDYLKKIYIESGIIENKIKVVPYALNKNITSVYDFYPDSNIKKLEKIDDENSFKFLFIGDLTSKSGIDILINAYNDLFSDNDNVNLTIVDINRSFYSSNLYLKMSLPNSTDLVEKFTFDIKKLDFFIKESIKKNNKINLLDLDLFGYDLNSFYKMFDCFVYPFKYDPLCFNVIDALSTGIPVIATNAGVIENLSNIYNLYPLKNKEIDLEIDSLLQIKLSNSMFEYNPDFEHLKYLMKNIYERKLVVKNKTNISMQEFSEELSLNNTFKLVYENIESLRDKPIFRYEFLEKKEKLDLEIDIHIKDKDYKSAELILLDLISYDISYMYKLSDVLIKQDKYEESLDYLTQILDYEGLSYSLCIMIAKCLEMTGDIETSMEYYNKSKDLIT